MPDVHNLFHFNRLGEWYGTMKRMLSWKSRPFSLYFHSLYQIAMESCHLIPRALHFHIFRNTEQCQMFLHVFQQSLPFRPSSSPIWIDIILIGDLHTCTLPPYTILHTATEFNFLICKTKNKKPSWFEHIHLNWARYHPSTFYPWSIFPASFSIFRQLPISQNLHYGHVKLLTGSWTQMACDFILPSIFLSANRLKATTGQKKKQGLFQLSILSY